MGKRGQVATEYLIILAIVVVISLIAVGVVRSMVGVRAGFNPAFSRIEWTAKEIILENVVIYSNNTAAVKLLNNANYPVVITAVGVGTPAVSQDRTTLYPGQDQTLMLRSGSFVIGEKGKNYNLHVEIIYHDADDPILQSSVSGTVTGTYQ
ncbi:class III signal peptide-containing protein [Candidatus Micrarchaeota archaeon]|nr:class III signal peptide-containing protein [Candidatus Micrarchaeota archaeon]